jgi:hypothetical protein
MPELFYLSLENLSISFSTEEERDRAEKFLRESAEPSGLDVIKWLHARRGAGTNRALAGGRYGLRIPSAERRGFDHCCDLLPSIKDLPVPDRRATEAAARASEYSEVRFRKARLARVGPERRGREALPEQRDHNPCSAAEKRKLSPWASRCSALLSAKAPQVSSSLAGSGASISRR